MKLPNGQGVFLVSDMPNPKAFRKKYLVVGIKRIGSRESWLIPKKQFDGFKEARKYEQKLDYGYSVHDDPAYNDRPIDQEAVAEFLQNHPKVSRVSYPGLESDQGYSIAKKQMSGYSGMISFELSGGILSGKHLMNNVKLCFLAESLGAVETMITHPATMTHAEVPAEERYTRGLTDGLVR